MRCRKVEMNLHAYITAQLEPPLEEEIRGHLSGCDSCRKEYLSARKHLSVYSKLPSLRSFPDFEDMIHRVHRSEASRKRFLRFTPVARVGVAALLFAALSLCFYWIFFPIPLETQVLQGKISLQPISESHFGNFFGLRPARLLLATDSWNTSRCKLSEGVVMNLGADTKVTIENSSRIVLEKGELFFQVSRGKRLQVETRHGEAEVKGTIFSIMNDDRHTSLAVFEGLVSLKNASGAVRVEKSQEAALFPEGPPAYIDKKSHVDLPWWEEGPLSIVLGAIHSNGKLSLELEIQNNSPQKFLFNPFKQGTPEFILNIEHQKSGYSTPLRSYLVRETSHHLSIPKGASAVLRCDATSLIKGKGEYSFTVVYQGSSNSSRGWKTILCSTPLKVTIP